MLRTISKVKIGLVRSASARFSAKRESRIVIDGLRGSGKTSILYRLKLGEVVNSVPTIGFNVESVQVGKMQLTLWDIGNQDDFGTLEVSSYRYTDYLIFVVDATVPERFEAAKNKLHSILKQEELKDCSVLVLCNKQDLPNAVSLKTISLDLEIAKLKQPRILVKLCSAYTGSGLVEGLEWLVASKTNTSQ